MNARSFLVTAFAVLSVGLGLVLRAKIKPEKCLLEPEEYDLMPPVYKYDSYEACLKDFGDEAVYCVTTVYLKPNDSLPIWEYIERVSSHRQTNFRHDILKWGVCLNRCQEPPDEGLYEEPFEVAFPHPNPLPQSSVEFAFDPHLTKIINICVNKEIRRFGLRSFTDIAVCMTQENTQRLRDFDRLDWLFCLTSLGLVGLALLGSFLDVLRQQDPDKKPESLLQSFSLQRNFRHLVRHRADDEFNFVNGYRALSSIVVVLLHTGFIFTVSPVSDPIQIECSMAKPEVTVFKAGPVLLQTIFAISAFFILNPVLERVLVRKQPLQGRDFVDMVARRLVRMVPLLAFVTLFSATFFPQLRQGPIWLEGMARDWQICRENWWRNLLFVNNLFGAKDICIVQNWHLSAEMQLFVLDLGLIFLINKFPRKTGIIVSSSVVLGVVATWLSMYWNGLIGFVVGEMDFLRTRGIYERELYEGHFKFYGNLPGHCMGLLAAYLLLKIRQNKVKLENSKLFRAWYGVLFLPWIVLIHESYFMCHEATKSSLGVTLYSALCKTTAALPVVTLLVALPHGTKDRSSSPGNYFPGFMRRVLSSRFLCILGKLNYGVFLVHVILTSYFATDGVTMPHFGSQLSLASKALVGLVASFCVAFFTFLLIELPVINYFRLKMQKRKPAVD